MRMNRQIWQYGAWVCERARDRDLSCTRLAAVRDPHRPRPRGSSRSSRGVKTRVLAQAVTRDREVWDPTRSWNKARHEC